MATLAWSSRVAAAAGAMPASSAVLKELPGPQPGPLAHSGRVHFSLQSTLQLHMSSLDYRVHIVSPSRHTHLILLCCCIPLRLHVM